MGNRAFRHLISGKAASGKSLSSDVLGCQEFNRGARLHRRQLLTAGSLSALGLGLGGVPVAYGQEALRGISQTHAPKAKRCIFLFMWGGPSQLDTFDLKLGSANAQVDGAASTAVTILTTNSLYLQTERMAGLRLGANYVQNGTDATQRTQNTGTAYTSTGGGNNNFMGYSLSLDYTWQKLYAAAAYSSFKQEQNISQITTLNGSWSTAFPGTPVTVGTTTNTNDNQWYVGAVYDFGVLKAYANYVNRKITGGLNSNVYLSRTAQQLGVRGNVTKTIEGWASVGNGRLRQFGATEPTANFNAWQLGSNYWLSKRTNLYAIYGQSITSAVSGSSVAGAQNGGAISQYALGLRHTF